MAAYRGGDPGQWLLVIPRVGISSYRYAHQEVQACTFVLNKEV